MNTIQPQTGAAFTIKKGQKLKVSTPKGEQVSDMVLFNKEDYTEFLFNGKTLDYEETIKLTTGHTLWSNRSSKMMTILEDTCGVHDFLLAPCDHKTFEIIYGDEEPHPSCFNNLFVNLKPFGIEGHQIPTAFNIFMNVPVLANGSLSTQPPKAKAGDYIIFEAQMDLLVGLTACSAEQSNNYSFSEIVYEILD